MTPEVGDMFRQFRILAKVGEGGMGEVFQARDTKLDRDVFSRVGAPMLVIHCRDDQVISFEEGRRLAALIPGAHLLPLPSGSHYFPTDRMVNTIAVGAIDRFAR